MVGRHVLRRTSKRRPGTQRVRPTCEVAIVLFKLCSLPNKPAAQLPQRCRVLFLCIGKSSEQANRVGVVAGKRTPASCSKKMRRLAPGLCLAASSDVLLAWTAGASMHPWQHLHVAPESPAVDGDECFVRNTEGSAQSTRVQVVFVFE